MDKYKFVWSQVPRDVTNRERCGEWLLSDHAIIVDMSLAGDGHRKDGLSVFPMRLAKTPMQVLIGQGDGRQSMSRSWAR